MPPDTSPAANRPFTRPAAAAVVRIDLDAAHDVVAGRTDFHGLLVMSTSASSLNWWYIDGRRLRMNSAGRRLAMSRVDAAGLRTAAGLDLRVDRAGHLIPGE